MIAGVLACRLVEWLGNKWERRNFDGSVHTFWKKMEINSKLRIWRDI
jgi:hypothetical protein